MNNILTGVKPSPLLILLTLTRRLGRAEGFAAAAEAGWRMRELQPAIASPHVVLCSLERTDGSAGSAAPAGAAASAPPEKGPEPAGPQVEARLEALAISAESESDGAGAGSLRLSTGPVDVE